MPGGSGELRSAGVGWYWRRVVRPAILERDGYRCRWCGGPATCVDHVKPRAAGGALFDPRNLVAACRRCNSRRSAKQVARPRRVWQGASRS